MTPFVVHATFNRFEMTGKMYRFRWCLRAQSITCTAFLHWHM